MSLADGLGGGGGGARYLCVDSRNLLQWWVSIFVNIIKSVSSSYISLQRDGGVFDLEW